MKLLQSITIIAALLHTPVTLANTNPVTAKEGMVVSAQHYATKAGIEVLKNGGNAIDAAVAVGYALAVVHPCCGNIGGGGFMMIHLADGKNVAVNFREKAPLDIKASFFLDKSGNVIPGTLSGGHISGTIKNGYLAAAIPGTVLGLNTALEKYGTLSLREVMQPAIKLAKKGYVLEPGDIELLNYGIESFKTQPNVAAIFLKHGSPYQAGDRLIQKDLAQTLETIAQQGNSAFYEGSIADKIITASQQHGGVFTKQDFKDYNVVETPPISCNYRGYHILTSPPPASGATICETLKISEGYPLQHYGFHSTMSIHYVAEAMRHAYADRSNYLGDPTFVDVPVKKLTSTQYAAQIRTKIFKNKAGSSDTTNPNKNHEKDQTTSYVVVDCYGNAVSVTYTINGYFGAKVIPDNTGFFLNNELDDFTIKTDTPNAFGLIQGKANLIEPGKRPLSSISPTIILKDNQLFMVIGTPGGPTIPTQIVETIQNVIDYNMNIQQAADASRFHMQGLPDYLYIEPKALPQTTIEALQNMGYTIKIGSPFSSGRWGAVTAILKDHSTGMLEGAMDARRPIGSAMGY